MPALVVAALAAAPVRAAETGPPEGRLLRFPDIHRDFVVFVYGGDIWRAPSAGGPARPPHLARRASSSFPKISPDGRWIAFSAEYTGTRQVYVMPAWGGAPRQLTFYNDVGPMPPRGGWDDWVMGWTPDGKILVRMNRVPWSNRMGRYFVVDPDGRPGDAARAARGRQRVAVRGRHEDRLHAGRPRVPHLEAHRGGRAQDVWIYDFAANRSERLTDDPATDNFPMWFGDTVYFTSDRERTLNIYALRPARRRRCARSRASPTTTCSGRASARAASCS